MTLENIMTTDAKIKLTANLPLSPPDLVYSGDVDTANPGVTVFESVSCRAPSNAAHVCVFHVILNWVFPAKVCPYTSVLYEFVRGDAVINATATKVRANGDLVMRENDTDACSGEWTEIATGAAAKCSCVATIIDGGQVKAKAQ